MPQTSTARTPASPDGELDDFLREQKLLAAQAFRMLRDARVLAFGQDIDLVIRAPDGGSLAILAHPGPWSVTLEPRTAVLSPGGATSRAAADLGADLRSFQPAFAARPDLNVIARAYAPHLIAWAQTGADLTIAPALSRGAAPGLHIVCARDDATALSIMDEPGAVGALSPDGRLIVWSDGDLTEAVERVAASEQSAQIRHIAATFEAASPNTASWLQGGAHAANR